MSEGPRLRIAYVLDVFDGVKTGGVISARRFVAALRERHDVVVVTSGAAEQGRVALPSFYPPLFGRVMREMGFVFAVPRRRVLEHVLASADVVHVQFPFWLGIRAASLARRLGKPVVAASHVQPENMFRNIGVRSSALSAATYRFFVRALYDRADVVVCPSQPALDELRRHGLRARAEIVSNGIAPEFRPSGARRRTRHEGKFLVLAVGRLAREKRVDVIVEGVRRSRHAGRVQLVVTGRGPEEHRLRALGAALPNPAEIGFVADGELLVLLETADLLVHASEAELEGMAVLEALGCGTPALIADEPLSAARRLAVSPDFLFRGGDPEDLARKLDRLVDDAALLGRARERCRELAAAHSFEASVRSLEAIYLRVTRNTGVAPSSRSTAPPAAP